MKLVIITVGSLGDTAPYIGLGVRLRAAGHDVAIAAQSMFEAPIRTAGLEFRRMPGDIRADLASEIGQRLHRASSWWQALPATYRLAEKVLGELADGIVDAARGAECLLLHRVALMHGHLVAKAMGVPFLVFDLFPSGLAVTGEFMPAGLGGGSLGRWGNRAVYRLMRATAGKSRKYIESLEAFQQKLGLTPIDTSRFYEQMDAERWPIYHAFSAAVVPRPADFREGLEIIGYLWPAPVRRWQPPQALADFLAAGDPPVFVGFGSLVPNDAERLAEIVTSAVRRAKVRALIQAGWGNLAVGTGLGDDVLAIGDVPHEWLFPQTAAVVHAASAGVTAAGLRAGVPAVPIPAMNDQPFWARRLIELGVSPGTMRLQKLSADRLAELVRRAVSDPFHRDAARVIAARMDEEDAAGHVVDVVRTLAERKSSARARPLVTTVE
jgi:UDP:flavonoid glycosyltransferase YjiC (YdhE family)